MTMVDIVGVRFKKACKVYDFEANGLELSPGEEVIVEVERGLGMGTVVNRPRQVEKAKVVRQLKKVVRKADTVDQERHGFNIEREKEAFDICREKIARYKLPMKLIRVEYLFDSSKAIFYFTSETRVDFRELVKDLASGFHTRIEMRQVGVRDEAKMIGGLGPCGRELCCSGFLSDFEPVTIKMAKEQGLALNPVKISGICGRLMCCLSYEHEMYKGEKAERRQRQQQEAGCGGCPGHAEGRHGAPAGDKAQGAQRAQRPERPERTERPRRAERATGAGDAGGQKRPERPERPQARQAGGPEGARGEVKAEGAEGRPEDGPRGRGRGSRKRRGRRRNRDRSGAPQGEPGQNNPGQGNSGKEGA